MRFDKIKRIIKRNKYTYKIAKKIKNIFISNNEQSNEISLNIFEITPVYARIDNHLGNKRRLNLVIPSINNQDLFGGISTAVNIFNEFSKYFNSNIRIIVTDRAIDKNNCLYFDGFKYFNCEDESSFNKQIISLNDRYNKTIPIGKNDIFIATAWWTAYNIIPIIHWQKETFNTEPHPLIYFIQDYEPGFYQWSTRYLLAENTYKYRKTISIFNSRLLYTYFKNKGYSFFKEYYFEPILHYKLKELLYNNYNPKRKKQIIIYGRPSVPRNAFELIVASLRLWTLNHQDIHSWNILSVGEKHPDITLSNGAVLNSLGKLSLDEYALLMKESYIGISLMVSPHPSYPPLEMSTFGVRTITNIYENKDLSGFNENIVSLENISPDNISKKLLELASEYPFKSEIAINDAYVNDRNDTIPKICKEIAEIICNDK